MKKEASNETNFIIITSLQTGSSAETSPSNLLSVVPGNIWVWPLSSSGRDAVFGKKTLLHKRRSRVAELTAVVKSRNLHLNMFQCWASLSLNTNTWNRLWARLSVQIYSVWVLSYSIIYRLLVGYWVSRYACTIHGTRASYVVIVKPTCTFSTKSFSL